MSAPIILCDTAGMTNERWLECRAHGPTRVNFSQTHIQVVTYPGRGTDDGEDFEDWSMHALRERVKLVQELDQLADRMVELALRLTREAQVIEEEYFIPQTRKVLVTTP